MLALWLLGWQPTNYMFFIFGIFIAIFLLLLLLIKKNKSGADKVLAFWLFFIFVNQLLNYFQENGDIYQYPHWLGVDFAMPVINGVLLYFYALEITGNTIKKRWLILVHLIPAISLIVLAIPFYSLSSVEKIAVFENDGAGFEWYVLYLNILIPLSGLVYAIWSLVLIKKHRLKIQDSFSNTDRKELQWLKYLSIGFIIIWTASIFFDNTIIYSAVVLLVLFIGFFGINQLHIFYTPLELESEKKGSYGTPKESKARSKKLRKTSKRYAKSGLSDEMASQIYSRLNGFMQNDAIYKNDNLTLTELAKLLDVHPNHLSQVINEREGKNFYNYINSLRIKEFIALASLPENKKYTLISLAYDVGFSTKSTFNKHFKAYTGKTPTEFINVEGI